MNELYRLRRWRMFTILLALVVSVVWLWFIPHQACIQDVMAAVTVFAAGGWLIVRFDTESDKSEDDDE